MRSKELICSKECPQKVLKLVDNSKKCSKEGVTQKSAHKSAQRSGLLKKVLKKGVTQKSAKKGPQKSKPTEKSAQKRKSLKRVLKKALKKVNPFSKEEVIALNCQLIMIIMNSGLQLLKFW